MGDVKSVGDRLEAVVGGGEVVLRVAFVVRETVPEKMSVGVAAATVPSVEELVVGVDFFVEQTRQIIAEIGGKRPFYPAPTEQEVVVDEREKGEGEETDG
jgi:hypothetical protein